MNLRAMWSMLQLFVRMLALHVLCIVESAILEHLKPGDTPPVWTNTLGQDLVVLSAPSVLDEHYHEKLYDLLHFDMQLARLLIGRDNVIVLADKFTLPYLDGTLPDQLNGSLPADVLLETNVYDVWLRDLGLLGKNNDILAQYPGEHWLDPFARRTISRSFVDFLATHNVVYNRTKLTLGGTNIVDNGAGWAIVNEQALPKELRRRGSIPNAQVVSMLQDELGYDRVALVQLSYLHTISHLDHYMAFVNETVLMTAVLPEPDRSIVLYELRRAFGEDLIIVEIDQNNQTGSWNHYQGACGRHVSMLVTDRSIFVPMFGHETENKNRGHYDLLDFYVVHLASKYTSRKVQHVPTPASICAFGATVRSLTWHVTGQAADQLVLAARRD